MATRTASLTIVSLGLVLAGACVEEALDPQLTETAEGGGGAGGSDLGGMGGEPLPSRGDPADFPSVCTESCEQACSDLDACGAAASSYFAMDTETCLSLCELSEGGPLWGDISHNFKCCASQTECGAVQHCGGWLAHPDVQASCAKMCECFFSSAALASVAEGHAAPAPYRFAEHAVLVKLSSERATMPVVPHTQLRRSGRYVHAQLGEGSGTHTLAQLASVGRVLPTFVDNQGRVSAASGRVYVRAKTAPKLRAARSIVALRSGSTPAKVRFSSTLYTATHADPWDAVDAVGDLRAAGLEAELDMVREHRFHYAPNDPLFPAQWHLQNVGQGDSTSGVDTRVSEAWDVTLGDPAVLIAINDDGVDLNHPDFASRLNGALNYPSDWQNLMAMGQFAGHGTSVAGVAAASADDLIGGAGACPGCRVIPHMLALTDGFGGFQLSDAEAAEGFERQVDAGAWVINNSWGLSLGNPLYAEEDQPSPNIPMVTSDAFQYAEDNGRGGLGTVIVFAAGNENTATDYYSNHPLSVSVAAIGDVGLKAYYSCFGPSITVAAPSNGGLSGITTSAAGGGHTPNFGGTSSASPLTTGIIGLIFSQNPDLTAAEARAVLEDSATPIDPVFAAYDQDGHSPYYGAGMVNAYVAVRMADQSCADPADCQAPSDDCGTQCNTETACEPCRTQADCAAGHVCQALPSLGRTVCVAEKGVEPCPAGTNEVNGHCLPLAETCGVCLGGEECNGRDDDCDGESDEGDACSGAPRCWIDSLPCADGFVCGATSCVPECEDDDDCGEGSRCRNIKDQYGSAGFAKGCLADQGGSGCEIGCSVLASSLEEEQLRSYTSCMMNGLVACNGAFPCASLLPIEM